MEICFESCRFQIFKIRDNNTPEDLGSNTHSVGDGTDSIVRLRTICGNLKNTFGLDRGENCFKGEGVRTVQQSGCPNWPLSSHLPKYALVVTRVP
jgi:hypothetical protein